MELIALKPAAIMVANLVFFLILGCPVAFRLVGTGLVFFIAGVELAPLSGGSVRLDWPLLNTLPNRMWSVMSNETLLAIPFFTFMAIG